MYAVEKKKKKKKKKKSICCVVNEKFWSPTQNFVQS